QDVRRGEQWRVSFAGAPPGSRALVLRQPKSLLFKYWSRAEVAEGADAQDRTFLLLAVCWGDGRWVVTTDPVQRVPLSGLCPALQAAETRSGASGREWSEPERFGQTLVAAPKNGTLLADEEVLAIVRHWSTAGKRPSRRKLLAGAVAIGVLILAGVTASSL